MKQRFYIQITIVLVSALCLSSLYYYITCAGLRSTREGEPGKINHTIYDTTHYDVLFAGSSRTARHIDAQQFTSMTGLSAYNEGVDGAGFTPTRIMVKRFIQKHGAPKYLFLNLDAYTLERDSAIYYYPLYYSHMVDDDFYELSKIEKNLKLGRYAPFWAVTYLDEYLKSLSADAYLGRWPHGDTIAQCKGFERIPELDFRGSADSFELNFLYDTGNLKKLDTLCRYFTDHGTQVFFMMAPLYACWDHHTQNNKEYYEKLRAIESKYGIKEFNHYVDDHFPKEMYFNHSHLNHIGAALYTQMIADSFLMVQKRKTP